MSIPTNAKVELFYSGAWHDITLTDDVLTRDPIAITRGRPDQASRTPPSMMDLSIRNVSGRYSPRNPMSPLYGLIGRNTPIRVSVAGDIRCVMEIESWPQRWNVTGSDVWAPVTAYGILRRLNASGSNAPAYSALRRSILRANPSAYWALEEGPESTRGASGTGGETLKISGAVAFIASVALAGSTGCADMSGGGQMGGSTGIPAGAVASWEAEVAVGWSAIPGTGTGTKFVVGFDTPGSAKIQWGVVLNEDSGSAGDWYLGIYTYDGTTTNTNITTTPGMKVVAGQKYHFRFRLDQSGADVGEARTQDGVANGTGIFAGVTLFAPTYARINPRAQSAGQPSYLSHVAVWSPARSTPTTYQAAPAYVGERAGDRINRLCAEDGIAFTVTGDPALSEPMGIQRPAPFLDLVNDAVEADGGILYEPRSILGLGYRTHRSLYNQTAVLTLNYEAGGEVAPPLFPVEDTDAVVNDVTVTRYQGSSSRAVKEIGPLNVAEPSDDPDGVGRIPKDYPLVLATDDQTFNQTWWRLHIGTWDEARYPGVNMDLTAMAVDGKTVLATAAAALDVGDRFVITHPPGPWLPPDDIELRAQGFVEVIESHHRTIAVNATPARPYNVGVTDSTTWGRLDNKACTLNEDLDTTETALDVVSVKVPWGSQFPYDVGAGGERMTVTARSGAGLSQTLTVTRSVNGVVKTHTTGAPVHLWNPLRLAR